MIVIIIPIAGGVPATLPVTLQAFGGDRLATGSTFELLCVALFADEETMVKWSRERPAADGVDEPPTSIGNNDMLDERFRKSNRYRMTGLQREESDVFDITLRIEGEQGRALPLYGGRGGAAGRCTNGRIGP